MMEDQLMSGLLYGNKGIIFSLDIALATTVVMILLVASTYQVTKSDEKSLTKLQLSRIGSDVIAYLDHQGVLDTLDLDAIDGNLTSILTVNYNMRIRLEGSSQTIETTAVIPDDRFVASGERILIINDAPAIVRYWIWLR